MSNPHNFTLRERLADWISGGALARERSSLLRVTERCDMWLEKAYDARSDRVVFLSSLRAILAATEHGKSGTAQKVARMARDALE